MTGPAQQEIPGGLLARAVLVHIETDATAAGLVTKINNWLAAQSEARLLEVQYQRDTDYSALILYTE